MPKLATILAADLDREVTTIQGLVAEKLRKSKTMATSRELAVSDIEAAVLCARAVTAVEQELGRTCICFMVMGRVIAEAGPIVAVGRLGLCGPPSPEVFWPEVTRLKNPIPGAGRLIQVHIPFPSERDRLIPIVRATPWYVSEDRHRSGSMTTYLDGELLAASVTVEGRLAPALGATADPGLAPTLGERPGKSTQHLQEP